LKMAENEEDSGSGPMLLAAAKRGNISLLKKLVEEQGSKLEVNSVDGLGNSALHYAAMGNHLDIATLLFEKYPNINPSLRNFAGDTPVHKAVEKNHLEFLKLLVEHKGDTTSQNNKKRDPMALARSNEARQILKSAHLANKVANVGSPKTTESSSVEVKVSETNKFKAELDPDMVANDNAPEEEDD